MPSIAQQDYIYVPLLEEGDLPDEIPQEIQNRLVRLAQDGRILDVVFTDSMPNFVTLCRPVFIGISPSGLSIMIFIYVQMEADIVPVECVYREIVPDAQEENQNDAQ